MPLMFCAESAMVKTPDYLSSAALVPVGARAHYIASAAHYEVIALRIVAALRDGGRPMVLVTGDPLADPEVLSEALGKVARPGYAVVIISCGPELKRGDLERAVSTLATPKVGGASTEPGCSAPASPLFIFDDFDRLSDSQIVDVYEGTQRRAQLQRAAVLLAPLDFPVRLERPALQCLKQRIAAQFRFQEVGDDEAIAVLHEQLLAQRDRRVEARGFRRGILIGSAVGGVAIVASIGVLMLRSTTEQAYEAPASIGRSNSVSEEAPLLPPALEPTRSIATEQAPPKADTAMFTTAPPSPSASAPTAALPSPPTPALTVAPPSPPTPALTGALPAPPAPALTATPPSPSAPPLPSTKIENQPLAATPPGLVHHPAEPHLSAAEISALLERGDAFLGTGDITSARSFFERAYDGAAGADSGLAALQLGATFDPVVLGGAGIRGVSADPVQALSWYRRARELGVAEAEQRIKALEIRPPGETGAGPH
jgi:hypothetical protein